MPVTNTSPRIQRLIKELKYDKKNNIDDFIMEIKEKGTPIVETCEESEEKLVTFIYIGDGNTEKVLVLGSFPGWDLQENMLSQITDTKIFYRTFKTSKKFVSTYRFSINDNHGNNWLERSKRYQSDPYSKSNMRFLTDSEKKEYTTLSVVELGLSLNKKQSTAHKVPQGNIRTHEFYSDILKNTRKIRIYTPSGYSNKGRPYKVIMSFDGLSTLTSLSVNDALDKLIFNKSIEPCVFIGIDNVDRMEELVFNENFNDFIIKELMPWIKNNFNVSLESRDATIGGYSLGGLASLFIALKNPNLFGNVISMSGAVHSKDPFNSGVHPWFKEKLNEPKTISLNIYMSTGYLEVEQLLEANRIFKGMLELKGHNVHFHEFQGGHDVVWWREEWINGLIRLNPKLDNAKLR
ncbi:alpha/beta hydrolase [Fictibacillus sp. BK138]|uniref:alpha/beta hydrolase n=1 Tax=Fictibacillus sp. BK138 TaxID=2512121 RepID=UPI001028DA02|nr:alpha/beta hydrolase-fold protein [Fictibacillus sp. BK138]RZT15486.1 enterochelin esterase family protein [Fictibacillus sp. BK138]